MGECISAHRDLHDNPLLGSFLIMHTLHLTAKFRPQPLNSDPCYRLRGNRRPAEARRDGECREPPNLGRGGWAEAGGTSVGRAAAGGRPAAVGSRTLRARYSARLLIQFQPFSVS